MCAGEDVDRRLLVSSKCSTSLAKSRRAGIQPESGGNCSRLKHGALPLAFGAQDLSVTRQGKLELPCHCCRH